MENIGYIELCLQFEQEGDGIHELTLQPMQAIAPLIIGTSILCGTSFIQLQIAYALASRETLHLGSQSKKVEEIQIHLRDWGFPLDPSKQLIVDGVFGSRTQKAVLEFQSYHDLTQDGIVGSKTYNVLSSPRFYQPVQFEYLQLGSRGALVGEIQNHLHNWGFPLNPSRRLVIDSTFGPYTQEAVLQFQAFKQLQQDGIVGSKTYAALTASRQSKTPSNLPEPVPQPSIEPVPQPSIEPPPLPAPAPVGGARLGNP